MTREYQKRTPVLLFYFILFSFFILLLLSQYSSNSLNPFYVVEYFIENSSTENNININNESLPNCSIYLSNKKKHQVLINGSYYPKAFALFNDKSINFECLQDTQTLKTILLWTPFFGSKNFGLTLGKETAFKDQKCPVTKCELTNDKSKLKNADIVVVHMRDSIKKIPLERYNQQRWVFTLFESPVHSPNFKRFNGIFNLTATYRIDSDFPGFYSLTGSKMEWTKNENFDPKKDFYAGKTDFAAAVISNCNDRSKRLKLIKELQKYIPVNVFGKCGRPCPNKFKNSTFADCKNVLATQYKFYFAFENSICKEYITEKFFVILKYDIIPVVYGGGPYDYYIPKSGFINVEDFASPKHLANYLLYLDQNRTAYNSYFEWKQYVNFNLKVPRFSVLCDMCIKLHMERFTGIEKKIYDNIQSHWHSGTCKPADIK